MTIKELQKSIPQHFAAGPSAIGDKSAMAAFLEFRSALERGEIRAASPDPSLPLGWCVNAWVKQGILLGFRIGALKEIPGSVFSYVDKGTFPARQFTAADGVRLVPGGSSVRAGAYVARGVVCMPRCTSTRGRGWTRAPWSIRMPWLDRARRSASAST